MRTEAAMETGVLERELSPPADREQDVQIAPAPRPRSARPTWGGRVRAAAMRFGIVYLTVYFSEGFIFGPVVAPVWQWFVPWVGAAVLGLREPISTEMTGSGDTMFHWVRAACILVLSIIVSAVWSLLARGRPGARVIDWYRVYLRYMVGMVLMGYGMAKVVPSQFRPPGPERLLQTYGDSSPMGLLWTFMGSSMPYTVFAGFAEVVPAVLLMFRQAATLGALLGAAVMLNVVMLNLCYDVPVKLYSLHLLLALMVLAAPDMRRVCNVLVWNRPVMPRVLWVPYERRWINITLTVVKTLFLILLLGGNTVSAAFRLHQQRTVGESSPMEGLFEVKEFVLAGEPRPPLLTDDQRWRRLNFSASGFAAIETMTGQMGWHRAKYDAEAGTLRLGERPPFTATWVSDHEVVLEGKRGNDDMRVVLRRSESDFLLLSRGFNWIQEYPYNR